MHEPTSASYRKERNSSLRKMSPVGIPTLDGLGVDGDGADTNHEYLLFSSIEPRTRLLQGLMERLK
jgi:hypothetical protein